MHVRFGLISVFLVLLAACGDGGNSYQGYIEGEFLLVGPEEGGRVTALMVREGQTVAADAPLFALDDTAARAAVAEARKTLDAAEARLADARAGARQPEIEALMARREQARANLELAKIQLDRAERLVKQGTRSQEALDEARAAYERDTARLTEINKEIEVARLGDRENRIAAARAEVEAARARLAAAEWRLAERRVEAPEAGRITEIIHRPGEVVGAGRPVVSLLPPDHVKARFFIPQADLAAIQRGDRIIIHCDGCSEPVPADISFIASEVEFTPPVIYSNESRQKLMVMVEARPVEPAPELHPGQPVDITVAPDGRNGD